MKCHILIFLSIFLINCSDQPNENYLKNGMINYRKSREVHQKFIENFEIKKVAFLKSKKGNFQYALLLNENITSSQVDNYSLGLHIYPTNYEGKFLIWDVKPELKSFGKNNYIIEEFKQPITKFDSIAFFLYDRDKYRNVIGHRVVLKNLDL